MSAKITGIRGMNDILPDETPVWQHVEGVLRRVAAGYGYREFRVPVLERSELFKRSIGEVTDIVEKEMYTFEDRNGESLTLRPEGTAGIVRAAISNGMLHNQKQKLWYTGPMFRYEKPQKGRYRQFHQFDVEVFGHTGPDIDAELIMMSARIWRELGIDCVELQLNSLGTPESRRTYREQLVEYFAAHQGSLDAENRDRLTRNPLRLLDSKLPDMQPLIAGAPKLTDSLDSESADHFAGLQDVLSAAGIPFTLNPRLVRGLDYYSRTVFEWVTDRLGAQGAVCAGGRYDGLVEQLGGRATPAIGWAMGLERVIELVKLADTPVPTGSPDVYVVAVGDAAGRQALLLAEDLREQSPRLRIEVHSGGGSFKSQFKKADKSGAQFAVILGEEELEQRKAGLKNLRNDDVQRAVAWDGLAAALDSAIATELKSTGR